MIKARGNRPEVGELLESTHCARKAEASHVNAARRADHDLVSGKVQPGLPCEGSLAIAVVM